MKVSADGQHLYELTDIQKKVICNDIPKHILEEDLKRRLQWILMHKYEQCFLRLKAEWESKLATRMTSIPTDPAAFAQLVFSQPDYKCRKTRDDEEAQKRA